MWIAAVIVAFVSLAYYFLSRTLEVTSKKIKKN